MHIDPAQTVQDPETPEPGTPDSPTVDSSLTTSQDSRPDRVEASYQSDGAKTGLSTDSDETTGSRQRGDEETDEKSHKKRPWKQMFAWVTGDREMEARVLAEESASRTDLTPEQALQAAKVAVADAHSDGGIRGSEETTASDVARPSDVVDAVKTTLDQRNHSN